MDLRILAQRITGSSDEFQKWVEERLRDAQIPTDVDVYYTGELFDRLLGVSQRSYQHWERRAQEQIAAGEQGPDVYPVPNPERGRYGRSGKTNVRRYTANQAMEIAHWYWRTKVKGCKDESAD
jgi:hypothetical protein